MKQRPLLRERVEPSHEEIARLAYKYYLFRDCKPGHELEDWLQAEQTLILNAAGGQSPKGRPEVAA